MDFRFVFHIEYLFDKLLEAKISDFSDAINRVSTNQNDNFPIFAP